MKKIYLSFVLFSFIAISVLSQTPQAVKYQAIARDDVGNIIADQDVSLRISILEGSASGTNVYSETHVVHTNLLGLLNIEIGNGTVVSGSFPSINWGSNTFFIKTEMDPAGGTSYALMGTSQLLSVPYSLYSENTAYVDDADADPSNEIQTLSKAGSTIELSDGGGAVNDDVDDADNNSANELQTLSKSGTNVTLSDGGGTVSIADNDNNATNELQTISKSGSTVTLSDGGGSFTDAVNDADSNPTNELQTISKTGSTVTLSNSGGSFTDAVNDADISPTNELQTLSVSGNNLSITNGNTVNLPTELPTGSAGKTLYHNGINWLASTNIFNNGVNVGIGTTNPLYKFHVVNAGGTAIYAHSEYVAGYAVRGISTKGVGIYGEHSDPSLTNSAIFAKNLGSGAGLLADAYTANAAVYGRAKATTGVNYAIRGVTSSPSGYAGYFEGGKNYFEGNVGMGTTNPSYPLHAVINTGASQSIAIYGVNESTGTGQQMWGVQGVIHSTGTGNAGAGVIGYSASTAGSGAGVRGESASETGKGVFGWAYNYSGINYGVYGRTNSPNGYASYFLGGENYFEGNVGMGTTNPSYPLHVATNTGTGHHGPIYGINESTGTGQQMWGVKGEIHSNASLNAGSGVVGYSASTTGSGAGVRGETASSTGRGVFAWATYSSGLNYGLFAQTNSPNGYAGYFKGGENYFEGNVGMGTTNPSYQLHVVDPSGTAIYAYSEYGSGDAVRGVSTRGIGIYGKHSDPSLTNPAIFAENLGSGAGLLADTYTANAAVYGRAQATTGVNYAIRGKTSSNSGYAGYFEGGENYFEGNVGMGTTNPSYPLHIFTDSKTRGIYIDNDYDGTSSKYGLYTNINSEGTGTRYGNYNYIYANSTDASPSYGGYFYVNSNNSPGNTYGIYASVSTAGTGNRWAAYFPYGNTYVGGDLRVGSTGGATGYKVSVDGKIMCEELKVELSGSWPDYVFDNEYQLMPLKELEKNIRKNKHLPGLPSANSVKENGIMVGDMTQILTKKVEELTLYIIELNNYTKELDNYTKELNKKVERLEKENKRLVDK